MWVVAINRMRSLIYANYAPKQRLCHPYLLSRIFWTETMTATFGSSGILSNCQSTTILGMSMKDYHQQRFHHDHDFTRFTITCTRAWRRRRGWAPSSRTGRRSQSESTSSAPRQVRSGKANIKQVLFDICFRMFPQRQHTVEDEWTLVRRRTTFAMFFKRLLGTRRKTRPEFGGKSHNSGISTEKINEVLPQTISRPPTLLRYHFEGTLYPSVLANGNT